MIPYFKLPSPFGVIQPFGVCVAIGILVGFSVLPSRMKQLGLDRAITHTLVTWVLAFGLAGAHILDVIAYYPRDLLANPLILIDPRYLSFSSFGGFLSGLLGLAIGARRARQPMLPYADAILFSVVPGWVFCRLGCFVAHDHPGRVTTFFLAVDYPASVFPGGPRHNLGLDEALFTVPLAIAFFVAARRPRRAGTYVAFACLAYAPFRFCLDFLRATDLSLSDARYFGLTPAQYGALAMFVAGLALTAHLWNRPLPDVVRT